ncbi:MAG: sigma-70 family RNA polymerase sigma factor [Pirellulales bacterium]
MTAARPGTAELISQGQGLVKSLAVKVHRSLSARVELDDLIAYGELGLAEAAQQYEPDQGTQFTTFAYYRIRGAIYDGLAKMGAFSRSQYRRQRKQQLANELLARDGEASSPQTLDQHIDWFRGVTDHLTMVHLMEPAGDDDGSPDSRIMDPRDTTSTQAAKRELNERVQQLLQELPAEERDLMQVVYYDGETLQAAATKMNISKSWASRLHARVLSKMALVLRRSAAVE